MCRGFRRYASLVVCVCFILSTLFLNTLEVEAGNNSSNSFTFSTTVYPNSTNDNTYGTISGGGGYINNGTGTITSNSGSVLTNTHEGYTYHVKVPFVYSTAWSNLESDGDYYANSNNYYSLVFTGFTVSSSTGTLSNVSLYTAEGVFLRTTNTSYYDSGVFYRKGTQLQVTDNNRAGIPLILEYDIAYEQQKSVGVTSSPLDSYTSTINVSLSMFGRKMRAEEIENIKEQVSDSGTQQKLDTLNESTEAIEESVTSDTGGGILATIKNFFGTFFQNVFDTLVSVFVPEDGFFSDWFNRLNTLLSEKLGMLYAPFDLLITTLNAIMNADTTDTGIPFPGIQWEDTYLVEPFTFYFSSLGDTFTDLQGYVYFATDTVLLFAFLYLLQNKIRLILEGHESG